ncbi:hypothetical protein Ancab_006624 [Ancistrocladus abbreviatus]
MAPSFTVKIVEKCFVSPPPASVPPTSLSLTFFDIPWLLFPPSQTLFFYPIPDSSDAHHFSSTILPNLKRSLSLSLRHFYPFSGSLKHPPESGTYPEIIYAEGNSVPVTVAESNADFDNLCGNGERDAGVSHQLVPELLEIVSEDGEVSASHLLAVQITRFGRDGFCIGLTYHHVSGDERTFNNFIKTWTAFSTENGHFFPKSPTSYDRAAILDPSRLGSILFEEFKSGIRKTRSQEFKSPKMDMVRATFVMSPNHIENTKQWILARCRNKKRSDPVLLSPYVVACAFVWTCLVRAHEGPAQKSVCKKPTFFGFIAGGMTRLRYRVPANYVGNCVAFGRAVAMRDELVGEDGILAAADVIGQKVKELDEDVLGGARDWISEWEVLIGSDLHLNVVGSPKVDLYKTDFGFGRPKKIEEISIDAMRGVSLMESRDVKGGMEIGLTLPKAKMDVFTSLFNEGIEKACGE